MKQKFDSHTFSCWFIHWLSPQYCFWQRVMFHSEVLYLATWSSGLLLHIYCIYNHVFTILDILQYSCIHMYARFPVPDKGFSLGFTTLHVISSAITLVSIVFFWESRSDMVCWGNHYTPIPVIDTSRKAFWDTMFS